MQANAMAYFKSDNIIKYLQPFVEAINGYFVGGCVRDIFLGRRIQDVDIATDLSEDLLVKKLEALGVLFERSLGFPVYSFAIEDVPVEVAIFRKETYPFVGRRQEVDWMTTGVTLEEDALRRDFTINSLYLTAEGELLNPTGYGKDDLENRVIRLIGKPLKRLKEDPLRIMRGIRFLGLEGFSLEEETRKAFIEGKPLLDHLGKETLYREFEKTICEGGESISFMVANDFLPQAPYGSVKGTAGLIAMGQFLLPTNDEVTDCVLDFYTNFSLKEKKLLKLALPYGRQLEKGCFDVVAFSKEFKKKDSFSEAVIYLEIVIGRRIALPTLPLFVEELAIGGEDILENSRCCKPENIGAVLQELLKKVQRGEVENRRDTLIKELLNQ